MSLSITIRFKNKSNSTSAWDEVGAKPCKDDDGASVDRRDFESGDSIKIVADEDKKHGKGHITITGEIVIEMKDGNCKSESRTESYIIEKSGGEDTFPK